MKRLFFIVQHSFVISSAINFLKNTFLAASILLNTVISMVFFFYYYTFKYVATKCSFRRFVSSSTAARCCRYRSFSSSLIRANLLPFLFFLGAIFGVFADGRELWGLQEKPIERRTTCDFTEVNSHIILRVALYRNTV